MEDEEGARDSTSGRKKATARSALLALLDAGFCRLEELSRVPQKDVLAAAHRHSSGTVFGWLIGLGLIAEQEKVVYIGGTKRFRHLLKEGMVTSDGLVCSCCDELFNLSGFEAHTGSKLRRPAANIFVGDEAQLSIADCQNVAFKMETLESLPVPMASVEEMERRDENEEEEEELPSSKRTKLDESFGTSPSVEKESFACQTNCDPFESCDYSKMLPPLEAKAELFNSEGLPVARRRKFDSYCQSDEDSGLTTVSSGSDVDYEAAANSDQCCGICNEGGELVCCETCPLTFHMECVSLLEVPKDAWFCFRCLCCHCGEPLRTQPCEQCERCFHPGCCDDAILAGDFFFCSSGCWNLFQRLAEMVATVNPLGRSELSWSLLRRGRCDDKLLAEALQLISSRFDPVLDCWTQLDYLDAMVFSRSHHSPRLDFSGFYTAVLQRGAEVVGVAVLRIHAAWLAEMPFIATKAGMEGQGICRSLFTAVEEMLARLGVEMMVLLAAKDTEKMWKNSFEFHAMDRKLKARTVALGLVALNGAGFLQKSVGERGWDHEAAAEEVVVAAKKRRRGRPRKEQSDAPATPPATRARPPRATEVH